MTDNPFDDPGEQDRTVLRPKPGGVHPPRRPVLPDPAGPRPSADPAPIELAATGDGPLAVAASPLLQLLGRLRDTVAMSDPGDMRERTRRELRAFERRSQAAGVPADQMRLAHYALCTALDDAVLNTPWGRQGRWSDSPLAQSLHQESEGGKGFFDQLRAMRDGLPATLPVLRLMYLCLSLGMAGPYRATAEGLQQLERIRRQVFSLVGGADARGMSLSPEMPARRLPKPRRARLPVWVAAAAALALVASVFVACLTVLNAASDRFYVRALAEPPSAMPRLVRPPDTPPPLPPPPTPDAGSRLRTALADLVGVEVISTPASATIRIPAAHLFAPGGATLVPGPLTERIARAVGSEPGPVRVLAYTDARTPRSVAFPSRYALTRAWAAAVRGALARSVPNPARLTAEGRADADPLAANTTEAGRERNRRVEIVLTRPAE